MEFLRVILICPCLGRVVDLTAGMMTSLATWAALWYRK